jgi:hypothetical protein
MQRYTKAADQKRLAVAAMEARAKNKGEQKLANPKEKLAKKVNISKIKDHLMRLATPAGLEPATCRLEGGCSIQLSYGVGRALRSSIQILMGKSMRK